MSLDTENSDTLKERQKLTLELIVNLVKIKERLKAEFNKDIPLTIE